MSQNTEQKKGSILELEMVVLTHWIVKLDFVTWNSFVLAFSFINNWPSIWAK